MSFIYSINEPTFIEHKQLREKHNPQYWISKNESLRLIYMSKCQVTIRHKSQYKKVHVGNHFLQENNLTQGYCSHMQCKLIAAKTIVSTMFLTLFNECFYYQNKQKEKKI